MDKIKEKSTRDNRTISNWGYLAVRKAVLCDDNDKQKEEEGKDKKKYE
jgi:hypothetical protein